MRVSEYLNRHGAQATVETSQAALKDAEPAAGVQLSPTARFDLMRMSSTDRAKLLGSVNHESQIGVAAALSNHALADNRLPRIEPFSVRMNLDWTETDIGMPKPDVGGDDGGEDIAGTLVGARWVGRDAVTLIADGSKAALRFDPSGSEALFAWLEPGVIIEPSGEVFRARLNKLPFGPTLIKRTGCGNANPDGPALARAALSILDAAITVGTREAATSHGPSVESLAGMILVRERIAAWLEA